MANERLTISLSEDEYQLLKLWATWHGKPSATYAGQILGARLEANRGLIESLVESAAQNRGKEYKDLRKEWLEE